MGMCSIYFVIYLLYPHAVAATRNLCSQRIVTVEILICLYLPMWIIRNSLGAGQIIPLCIWTLLVSVVLGIAYYQCRNLLFIAILHATFNICYLAPIAYNIAALALVIIAVALLWRQKWRSAA